MDRVSKPFGYDNRDSLVGDMSRISEWISSKSREVKMLHRHLNHEELTITAVDDMIARGKRVDWLELQQAFLSRPVELKGKILAACKGHLDDPYEQRYRLWKLYAERKIT